MVWIGLIWGGPWLCRIVNWWYWGYDNNIVVVYCDEMHHYDVHWRVYEAWLGKYHFHSLLLEMMPSSVASPSPWFVISISDCRVDASGPLSSIFVQSQVICVMMSAVSAVLYSLTLCVLEFINIRTRHTTINSAARVYWGFKVDGLVLATGTNIGDDNIIPLIHSLFPLLSPQ